MCKELKTTNQTGPEQSEMNRSTLRKIDFYVISFSTTCRFSCLLEILCSTPKILMSSLGFQNCFVWFRILALHIKIWLFSAGISPTDTCKCSCNFLLVNSKYLFTYFLKFLFIYYFGCAGSQLQHAGSLVAACGLLSWGMQLRDLVPPPGIEPGPPALGAQSLTDWTTREVPNSKYLNLESGGKVYIQMCNKLYCFQSNTLSS